MPTVTMAAEQGVDFVGGSSRARSCRSTNDDYGVFRSPLAAFQRGGTEAGHGDCLLSVARGETVPLSTSA
jgi:hypothetical protein